MSCRLFGLCELCENPGIVRANGAVICEACRAGFELRPAEPRPDRTTRAPAAEPEKEA